MMLAGAWHVPPKSAPRQRGTPVGVRCAFPSRVSKRLLCVFLPRRWQGCVFLVRRFELTLVEVEEAVAAAHELGRVGAAG